MDPQPHQVLFSRTMALGAFVLATAIAYFLTPLVGRLAERAGAVDRPGQRKIHERTIPRWGGIAILVAFLFTFLLGWWVAAMLDVSLVTTPAAKRAAFGVVLGALIVALVGALDDLYDLSPFLQIAGQGIAATAAMFL
ncbi:MAG: hypothetical protein QHJ73_07700, partial [Armatimonadota bacterium]|nr:hypothetical protein [Armatimonadota bacterium]